MRLKQITPKKSYNKEVMKNYSLDQLQLKGSIKLLLGDIVALKGLAIRKGFNELADKLRVAENKILHRKK